MPVDAGSGHSNSCMLDDSIVLDLELMNRVQVDVPHMTAIVEGGAYLRELDQAVKPHRLATPVGTFPLTGVGGLVLGGGRGWLTRLHGFSVDNLLEVEVVLANGDVVLANDNNDFADLIKGCRGAGGNFGVVTWFKLRLHRLPPSVFGGYKVFFAPTHASMVNIGRRFDRLMQDCPQETSAAIIFGSPWLITTMWAHFGDEKYPSEVQVLNEASRLGGWLVVEDSIRPMSYHDEVQEMTRQHNQSGYLYNTLVQLGNLSEPLPDEFFQEMVAFTRRAKHQSLRRTEVALFVVGRGYDSEIPAHKTSLDQASRDCRYFAIVDSHWDEKYGEEGKEEAKGWARECARILSKYCVAKTFHAAHAGEERESTISFDDDLIRYLHRLKSKYDPQNVFRQNCNIDPSTAP